MRRDRNGVADPDARGDRRIEQQHRMPLDEPRQHVAHRRRLHRDGERARFVGLAHELVEQIGDGRVAAPEIQPGHVALVEEAPLDRRMPGQATRGTAGAEALEESDERRHAITRRRDDRPVAHQPAQDDWFGCGDEAGEAVAVPDIPLIRCDLADFGAQRRGSSQPSMLDRQWRQRFIWLILYDKSAYLIMI
jgi:hypothetical protein